VLQDGVWCLLGCSTDLCRRGVAAVDFHFCRCYLQPRFLRHGTSACSDGFFACAFGAFSAYQSSSAGFCSERAPGRVATFTVQDYSLFTGVCGARDISRCGSGAGVTGCHAPHMLAALLSAAGRVACPPSLSFLPLFYRLCASLRACDKTAMAGRICLVYA